MNEPDPRDGIAALEKRLERIEALLGLAKHETPPAPPIISEPPPSLAELHVKVQTDAQVMQAPEIPLAKPADIGLTHEAPTNSKKKTKKSRPSLEQTLGLKWTGWVGAIVLLVGASFGVRFAYEQGWLGGMSDAVRLMLIAAGGFALIGVGEWAYRRVNVVPAASLFGAGVATLFLASYAGHAYYKLYDPGTAFTLMALATLTGALVARRGNMVSIAVLSLLGGNITPLVLSTDHPRLTGFLLYLGMLQAVALVLAFTGPSRKWWMLRGLSLATNIFWMTAVLAGSAFGQGQPTLLLTASVIFALGYQLEVIATSARWQGTSVRATRAGTAFSMLVTAALTTAVLWILRDQAISHQLGLIAVEAIACAALATSLRRSAAPLAGGFTLQAWGLVALLIPVGLTRQAVIIGWGILAITMALLGRFRKMREARTMAVGIWLLALADLVWRIFNTDGADPIHAPWMILFGTPLAAGLILAWGLALGGEVIAWLMVPADGEEHSFPARAAGMICLISEALWIAVSIEQLPMLGATLAIAGMAWVLALADIFTKRLRFAGQAMALLAIAAVKWATTDGVAQRLSPAWSAMAHRPLVNSFMGVAVVLAFSFPAIYALRRQSILSLLSRRSRAKAATFTLAMASCAIGVLTIGFSLQIDLLIQRAVAIGTPLSWPAGQMENLALTLLWSAAAAGLWMAGTWADWKEQSAARAGWLSGLGVLLAGKFVIVDSLLWLQDPATATVGLNLSVAAALGVAALVLWMATISLHPRLRIWWPAGAALTLALFVLGWAGSFEIERAVRQELVAAWRTWPRMQLTGILLTGWWAIGAAALFVLSPKSGESKGRIDIFRKLAAWILILLTLKYLTVDTLLPAVLGPSPRAAVLANPQALAAAILIAALGLVWGSRSLHPPGTKVKSMAGFLMMLTTLWIGTLEIGRVFQDWIGAGIFSNRQLAQQVAISIFWGMFAVSAVAAGFSLRAAAMRYFGLALFGVTLVKVVVVDLEQISTGYRVLSFMALGALLMGTSVLYGKLSPKLLDAGAERTGTAGSFPVMPAGGDKTA